MSKIFTHDYEVDKNLDSCCFGFERQTIETIESIWNFECILTLDTLDIIENRRDNHSVFQDDSEGNDWSVHPQCRPCRPDQRL